MLKIYKHKCSCRHWCNSSADLPGASFNYKKVSIINKPTRWFFSLHFLNSSLNNILFQFPFKQKRKRNEEKLSLVIPLISRTCWRAMKSIVKENGCSRLMIAFVNFLSANEPAEGKSGKCTQSSSTSSTWHANYSATIRKTLMSLEFFPSAAKHFLCEKKKTATQNFFANFLHKYLLIFLHHC